MLFYFHAHPSIFINCLSIHLSHSNIIIKKTAGRLIVTTWVTQIFSCSCCFFIIFFFFLPVPEQASIYRRGLCNTLNIHSNLVWECTMQSLMWCFSKKHALNFYYQSIVSIFLPGPMVHGVSRLPMVQRDSDILLPLSKTM